MTAIDPKVSVIIPTYNQQENLCSALHSLASLQYDRDKLEVIVVNDGSTDKTKESILNLQADLPYSFCCVSLDKKSGISKARNAGVQQAAGSVLVFTDDDCLFEKDWLKKLVKPFRDPETGTAGGPDKTPEGVSLFSKCVDYLFTSFVGTGGLRRGGGVRLGQYYPKGCNVAILREAMDKVGMYDELLQPCEDIEMGYRIKQGGYKIAYVPEAFVWHKRRSELIPYLKKMFGIGYGRTLLVKKHRGLFQTAHTIPFSGMVLFAFLLFFSFFSPAAESLLQLMLSGYTLILLLSFFQAFFIIKDIRGAICIPPLLTLHLLAHGTGVFAALGKKFLRI